MGEERLTDHRAQRAERRIAGRAGDGDLLRLPGAPFGDAEEEAEARGVALDERPDRVDGSRRRALVALVGKENGQAQQNVGGDGIAGRRGVVEEVLRPRDQLLVINRRVEEAALLVGEPIEYL